VGVATTLPVVVEGVTTIVGDKLVETVGAVWGIICFSFSPNSEPNFKKDTALVTIKRFIREKTKTVLVFFI
jgi:hypothetical protein